MKKQFNKAENYIEHMKKWIKENNKDMLRIAYRWLDSNDKEIKDTKEWKEFIIESKKNAINKDFKM